MFAKILNYVGLGSKTKSEEPEIPMEKVFYPEYDKPKIFIPSDKEIEDKISELYPVKDKEVHHAKLKHLSNVMDKLDKRHVINTLTKAFRTKDPFPGFGYRKVYSDHIVNIFVDKNRDHVKYYLK